MKNAFRSFASVVPFTRLFKLPARQLRLTGFPLVLAFLGLLSAPPAQGQAPTLLWINNVGAQLFTVDAQTNLYAFTNGTVVKLASTGAPLQTNTICPLPGLPQLDAAGNYYFAGSFDGTQNFGGITLVGGFTNTGAWQPGWPSCYLAKYNNAGILQWVTPFGLYSFRNRVDDLQINPDGTFIVGFDGSGNARLAQFSATGSLLWQTAPGGSVNGDCPALKVGALSGTNGCFLQHRTASIVGGFYDTAGHLTFFSSGPLAWKSPLSLNARPAAGPTNNGYVAGLNTFTLAPVFEQDLMGGTLVWDKPLGAAEQWILANDSQRNLFLADTNGAFSKYDGDGNLIWSTNYGLVVLSMLLDVQGNRFLNFADGSVARLSADPAAQPPIINSQPLSQTIFVGDGANFASAAGGTPPLHYSWTLNGVPIPNATSAVLTLSNATPSLAGSYAIVVTNVAGAVTSSPALLRVKSVQLYLGNQLLTNGTYTFASPPALAVHSAFPNGSAFYSLDGSAPSFVSTFYSGPFAVSQSATVRALGYDANFTQSEEADPVHIIVLTQHNLSATTPGGGSVTLNPAGGTYLSSTTVTATAVPAAGYSFLYWLGDATGTNPAASLAMDSDKSVRAVFGTTLSTSVSGNGAVTLFPPAGPYPFGSIVRLTGVPQPGNFFGFWGNAASGNNNPLYFAIGAANQTVSSIFGATASGQAALTVQINGRGRVNVNPRANSYALNQSVSLAAVPDAGQTFVNWSGDASGTQNPLTVVMNAEKLITANFSSRPSLRASQPGVEGLTPQGFRLTLLSDPQSVFQIMASTNFVSWQNLATITNTMGEVQFTDPAAANFHSRFYKAIP